MIVNQAIQLARKRNSNKTYEVEEETIVTWSQELKIKETDSMMLKVRKSIYSFLTDPSYSRGANIFSKVFILVIIGSVMEFVLETVYTLTITEQQIKTFLAFEMFFNVVFSIEYFSKVLFFPDLKQLPKFLVKPFWLIDLVSILPFYIELIITATGGVGDVSVLRVIRIVRVFRIFRLLKASKNLAQIQLLGKALVMSKQAIFIMFFLISNILLLFGSFVFYSEQGISEFDSSTGKWMYIDGTNAGKESAFQSIPHTMWFMIVTISTVGYGDMYFLFI